MLDQSLLLSSARMHQRTLIEEAHSARLADLARQAPAAPGGLRHGLAVACHRLADWLDGGQRARPRLALGVVYLVRRTDPALRN